ncbi:MAG: PadR family transcriptional regulator [Chloroflexi bacterium]|nr:PadR family transcriptional regulator [Chloroflexota bacterium]
MTTNTELVILSLVAEKPRHGYEIEQVIEERGMRDWTEIGFSSIYYLLKKLEQAELIKGQLKEAERGPARKVYQPTPVGYKVLCDGVLEALSTPHRCYSPLQLGLANLPIIAPAEVLTALSLYQDGLIARLEHVRVRWESQRPLPYFVDAMFEHTIAMGEAELGWLEKFIKQVEEQNGKD